MKQPNWKSAAAAVALLCMSAEASAQETTLVMATTLPAQHIVVTGFLQPWADRINEQGKGVLKIDVRNGPVLANPGNYYDRILSDVAQIGWGNLSPFGSKFVASGVVGLPFISDKADIASVAFWRLYKTGLLDKDFDDSIPLVLTALPQSAVMLSKPVQSLDNLNGLKIGVGSRVTGEIIQRLGGTPISMTVGEMYELLQRNTVNGIAMTFTAVPPFKLQEVASYYVDTQLTGASGAVLMSRKK